MTGAAAAADIPFSGVVLCGGDSRRMGSDKAQLRVAGWPMAVRVADALRRAGAAEVFGVGGAAVALGSWGLAVVPDEQPGAGPLSATITALGAASEAMVAVLACDLIEPDASAIRCVIDALRHAPDEALGAVPVLDGHHQWMHAAWRRGARTTLMRQRSSGAQSLRRAAGSIPTVSVEGIAAVSLADADFPHDLVRARGGAGRSGGSLARMDLPEIDIPGLARRRSDGGLRLIDVREHDEFLAGRVPGAYHIPLGDLAGRTVEVPTEGTVYVICARGGRSSKAVAHLRSQGVDAVNVAGGTLAWVDAGHPVERGPAGATGGP